MGEKKYRVENVFTRDKITIPERFLETYRDATEPTTGKRLYRFMDDVQGYMNLEDGTIKKEVIPADSVHQTGVVGSSFVLPKPGMEKKAKSDEHYRRVKQSAKDVPFGEVATRSFASGMSGGLSTKINRELYGEGYAEVDQMSIEERGMAHFTGRAASLVVMGMLPIPGLGKAAGMVVPSLKGAKNVGSIFELGAAVSQKTRGLVSGKGFVSEFKRKMGGTMAFGATVEVPMSLAMASADLVDHNQDYTAEAIGAGFLSQYLFAMGITGVTAVPLSLIGAGVSVAGKKAITQIDDLLVAEGKAAAASNKTRQEFFDSGFKGLWRYTSRRNLRGRYLGMGDIIETQGYKIGRRLVKGDAGKLASETRIGRWLAGVDADDFIRYERVNKKAIVALSEAQTARQMREAADVLLHNLRDPDMIKSLQFVRENADTLIPARRAAQSLIVDSERMADNVLAAKFRHRLGMQPVKGVKARQELVAALDARRLDGKSLPGNYMAALDETLNRRRAVPVGQSRDVIDRAILKSYEMKGPSQGGIEGFLKELDGIDVAAQNVKQVTKEFRASGSKVDSAWKVIGNAEDGVIQPYSLRNQLGKMNGTYRGLTDPKVNAIVDTKPFTSGKNPLYVMDGKAMNFTINTRLDDLAPGLSALGRANSVRNSLLMDATPLIRAAKPVTQTERLAAQVETVIDTKRRIKAALMYIAVKGGGGRHTAVFGGVYAFREMATMAEKRDSFRQYRDLVVDKASNIDALQAHVAPSAGEVAMEDVGLGAAMAANQMTIYSYLAQQAPTSADATIGSDDFSSAEMENFLEAVGAAIQPISVLATAADGSTSGQGVDAFRAMYPELYMDAVLDVAEFVEEYGHKLGHEQLLGLDAFTGYALGYSDGPAPNLTYQPPYYQTTGAAQSAGAMGGPEAQRMNLQQNTTPAQKVGAM